MLADDRLRMIECPSEPPAYIAGILERLAQMRIDADVLVSHVSAITDDLSTHTPLQQLNEQTGLPVEHAALYVAALRHAAAVSGLRVADSVRGMLEKEFTSILGGEITARSAGEPGTPAFSATCKIVTLRRMPAGCMDWETDGFPRSWLAKVPRAQLIPTLWFLATRTRGFRPFYFMHVARRPRNRGLLIEREVMKAYWRIATSAAQHPEIKGLLAGSWFHDVTAIAANPHLEWLNRPYLQEGGFITHIGDAPADSGFTEHNPERKALYERGELRFRLGVAVWPRDAMIDWANRHPEFGD
jgi:hypothetical protein